MGDNPYESPRNVGENAPDLAFLRARRWVAAPAIGVRLSGAICLLFGVLGAVMALVLMAKVGVSVVQSGISLADVPVEFWGGFLGVFGGSLLMATVGALGLRWGRRLDQLDSRWQAIAACVWGLLMFPLCVVTLPLGVYGLIVLRRGDVGEVLHKREAERRAARRRLTVP
jgi:hypothetical protein